MKSSKEEKTNSRNEEKLEGKEIRIKPLPILKKGLSVRLRAKVMASKDLIPRDIWGRHIPDIENIKSKVRSHTLPWYVQGIAETCVAGMSE